MTAHDRVRRGPLAALLILLSLFLGSTAAGAAGTGLSGPATRLGSGRNPGATALLPTATRNSLDDETSGLGDDPSVLPPGPAIVTVRLWARPRTEAPSAGPAALPRPASASYRARAPPAS